MDETWLPLIREKPGRKPAWFVRVSSDLARAITRTGALAGFVTSVAGFVIYPRPWGSHWTFEKLVAVNLVAMGGFVALISLLACLIAWGMAESCPNYEKRPLLPALFCIAISLAIGLFTPAI